MSIAGHKKRWLVGTWVLNADADHRESSNSNFRGFLNAGALENTAGLLICQYSVKGMKYSIAYIEVPHIAAGLPIMMLSDTPAMLSVFP